MLNDIFILFKLYYACVIDIDQCIVGIVPLC